MVLDNSIVVHAVYCSAAVVLNSFNVRTFLLRLGSLLNRDALLGPGLFLFF